MGLANFTSNIVLLLLYYFYSCIGMVVLADPSGWIHFGHSVTQSLFASWWLEDDCQAGCLIAAESLYNNSITNCSLGELSSDCRCDLSAPTNECPKGGAFVVIALTRDVHPMNLTSLHNPPFAPSPCPCPITFLFTPG